MQEIDIKGEQIVKMIDALIHECGGTPGNLASDLTTQMIQTSLKLMLEGSDIWQMKLMSRALKEMRYAFHTFSKYPDARCVSIFGSARTPEHHPDFIAAEEFSRVMAKKGWMCITGAAEGIMRAGIKGAELDSSFGLSIRLPFEGTTNSLIKGDPKLMIFNYFFTRKLMFLSNAHAVAAFPGGFGTLDELFEVLTLMQTGKTNIVPLVLLEGEKGNYWKSWEEYLFKQLLDTKWISKEDPNFYYIASTPEDARNHIMHFYKRYHSNRYVRDQLVIRLLEPLTNVQLDELNNNFGKLLASGKFEITTALPEETDFLKLPRLVFTHTKRDFGLLRAMIDKINSF